jgi:hypothetical protein
MHDTMRKMNRKLSRLPVVAFFPVLLLLIGVDVWCGLSIYRLSTTRAALKKDYTLINGIGQGLLSVNLWRDNIRRIAAERISDFTLTPTQEKDIKAALSRVMNTLITKADSMVEQSGKVKRLALQALVNWKAIREKVPQFSQDILNELKRPENKTALLAVINEKLNEAAAQTL